MGAAIRSLLTPTEAALVAGVSVRDINRVFDERLLPSRFLRHENGRRVRSDACAFVSFYFRAAADLTVDARSRVIRVMAGRDAPSIYSDDLMTVKLDRFVKDVAERHAVLRRAKATVVQDPDILSGTPVIRGTRIPVYDIAAAAHADASTERLLSAIRVSTRQRSSWPRSTWTHTPREADHRCSASFVRT